MAISMMSHFPVSTMWLWGLGQNRGSSSLRRPWDLHIWKFPPPRMHVFIKWSIKRLFLTPWNTSLITSFTVSWKALVTFADSVCGSHRTKNRHVKVSVEFWKGFLFFVVFRSSASITFCGWIEACSMPPRQYATFTGIFLWLYPKQTSNWLHTVLSNA